MYTKRQKLAQIPLKKPFSSIFVYILCIQGRHFQDQLKHAFCAIHFFIPLLYCVTMSVVQFNITIPFTTL